MLLIQYNPLTHVSVLLPLECQTAAWRSGHKAKCAVLKKKHDAFLESLQAVERAHETGTMEGIQLSVQLDYFAANVIFEYTEPYPPVGVQSDDPSMNHECASPQGPSMKYFYENFGRVLRDEWWFYSSTAMEEYRTKLSGDPFCYYLRTEIDQDYFDQLLCCLSYDIFGFAAEMAGESDFNQDALLNFLFEESLVKDAKDANGIAMPAERFIEIYQRFSLGESGERGDERVRNRLKSNKKAFALKFFRENFHK